jgi:hypothetical protein
MLLIACSSGGGSVRQINPLHIAHNAMTTHLLTANVGALAHSGQVGSASIADSVTVTDLRPGIEVSVRVQHEPQGAAEPAFLARSNCTPPSRRAWKQLAPVVAGRSKTTIHGVRFADIKGKRYALVVDRAHSRIPVACADFEF